MGWKVIAWEERPEMVTGILEHMESGQVIRIEEDLINGTSLEIELIPASIDIADIEI